MLLFTATLFLTATFVASNRFSLVPADSCTSFIQICFEGDFPGILQGLEDRNPCHELSVIKKGGCTDNGFEHQLGDLNGLSIFAKVWKAVNDVDDVCWKSIEYRGLGRYASTCESDEEKQFGFCFKKCEVGKYGEGPLCLGNCKEPLPASVGVLYAVGCKDESACGPLIASESFKILYDLAKAIMDGSSNPLKLIQDLKKIFEDAMGLKFPDCDKPKGLRAASFRASTQVFN